MQQDDHREPWECTRGDGEYTQIKDAICTKCEQTIEAILGEDTYSAESVDDGYKITMTDDREEPHVCACECGCEVLDVEFDDICSYCRQVTRKDD